MSTVNRDLFSAGPRRRTSAGSVIWGLIKVVSFCVFAIAVIGSIPYLSSQKGSEMRKADTEIRAEIGALHSRVTKMETRIRDIHHRK